jgi:small neutral amino acid transporter SnatA (MarC family)
LFLAAGGFSIVSAVQDWDWFLQSRKARLFVNLMGRKGARIFYGILGLALVALGAALLAGIIEPGQKR